MHLPVAMILPREYDDANWSVPGDVERSVEGVLVVGAGIEASAAEDRSLQWLLWTQDDTLGR
ncbi:hypothetical protein GCM10009843_38680 [Nocardioides bigeumensis]|uniref:Uncharacterized protein n=2 Tax=Nocardioides bigeumensis TaxID=433657 RepID=A0ABN2YY05_9ACTN